MRARSAVITSACLGLSAVAVVTLAYLETTTARADVLLRPEPVEVAPTRIRAQRASRTEDTAALTKAAVAANTGVAPVTAVAEVANVPEPQPVGLLAPDWV